MSEDWAQVFSRLPAELRRKSWAELSEEWEALPVKLRDELRASVPIETAVRHRQISEVVPNGTDTAALDCILSSPEERDRARLLGVRCAKKHRLADVFDVEGEQVYVADADSHVDSVSVLDVGGLHMERWKTWGRGRELHIEYLDRLEPDRLPTYCLPARCKCDGAEAAIPALWLARQLGDVVRWATWPAA